MAASGFLMRLGDSQISFVIDLNESYSVEEFVVMAMMGFFEYRGTGYHFAIPADLDSSTVRAAALSFAQTEDEDYSLHPEHVVSWMPLSNALQCQWRHLALFRARDSRPRQTFGTLAPLYWRRLTLMVSVWGHRDWNLTSPVQMSRWRLLYYRALVRPMAR
jgi:hypothetical protein